MRLVSFALVFMLCAGAPALAGAIVAAEDFDGGDVNLVGSSVPLLDGGGGDFFGVGNRNAWPQGFPTPGVPFSIADDSVFGYANGSPFAGDVEGVYGQNSDLDNNYLGISDTREWTPAQTTATWTFNISGFTDLRLSVGMGGISDASFGGYDPAGTLVTMTAQIDAGPIQTAFDLAVIEQADAGGYLTRLMDGGAQSGGGRLLQVGGDNAVTKLLAENGAAAADTFTDKTPTSGAGAGELDSFVTDLNGAGSTLTLTLTGFVPFEAMTLDNIVVTGVPEPASMVLLGMGALAAFRRR